MYAKRRIVAVAQRNRGPCRVGAGRPSRRRKDALEDRKCMLNEVIAGNLLPGQRKNRMIDLKWSFLSNLFLDGNYVFCIILNRVVDPVISSVPF